MAKRSPVSVTVWLLWAALLLLPMVILSHSEFRGDSEGWIHASLSPDAELYAWTRNRLLSWGVLYLVGTVLLGWAMKRDPGARRLCRFLETWPGTLLLVATLCVAQILMTFSCAADAAVVLLLVVDAIIATWAITRTSESLGLAVGRGMTICAAMAVVASIGELVLRHPDVVDRTGGSLEARSDLWDRTGIRRSTGSNIWGLRSRHLGKPKEPGTFRIVAIGDSFTAGDWVDSIDDTWPYVTEAALQRDFPSVEVINAGLSGSDTTVQARMLASVGWLFAPDVLILQYTLNDTGGNVHPGFSLIPILDKGLRRKSHLYSFLNSHFQALQTEISGNAEWAPYLREDYPGWQESRAALGAMVDEARKKSLPVILLVYPFLTTKIDDASYPYLDFHSLLRDTAKHLGIAFIDARPLLASVEPRGRLWWAREFDSHPNARAHRIVGEAVASKILELRFLPR